MINYKKYMTSNHIKVTTIHKNKDPIGIAQFSVDYLGKQQPSITKLILWPVELFNIFIEINPDSLVLDKDIYPILTELNLIESSLSNNLLLVEVIPYYILGSAVGELSYNYTYSYYDPPKGHSEIIFKLGDMEIKHHIYSNDNSYYRKLFIR